MRIYEQKIVGGILAGIVSASALNVGPSDLADDSLRSALTTLQVLEGEGVRPDADILALRLAEQEQSFLNADDFRLMQQASTSAAVVFEAVNKVRAASLQTTLRASVAELALKDDMPGPELLRELRRIVDEADRGGRTQENSFVYLSEIGEKTKAVVSDLHAGVSYAVSTGFHRWDELLLDGFSRGDSHIIVGFTGSGKSALALECARNQAVAGHCVGVVSREMSDTENHIRILANAANIPRYCIRRDMSDFTKRDLLAAIEYTSQLRIAFDTTTSRIEDLRPRVREMVERDGMSILYVDYLQLMGSDAKGGSRADEVQTISRTLKLIAMENNIPVVSLSQFNRSAKDASVFEILSHLKESSGIEQDASTISYVQIERTQEPKDIKAAKVTVLKNRNGSTFQDVPFEYDGKIFRFTEAR